jgi:hypothetical protein
MARGAAALRVVDEDDRPHEADIESVREFAEGLPERYLHCREMGHNWRPFSAGRFEDGGFERILRCTRCKTKRMQSIDSHGMVLSSRYEHPKGYLTDGMGRIVGEGRGALRLESIKRIVTKAEEAD